MSEQVLPIRRLHLTIEAKTGWAALKLGELWQFRDLLFSLAGRDLKVRYKQTILGVVWVVLQPMLAAGIFTVVFGQVAGMDKGGKPMLYFLLTYCGQLAWNMFSWTVLKSSECLLNNSQLVSKVYFPRLVLPLSTVLSTLVDVLVGMSVLALLLIGLKQSPGGAIVLLPVWCLLLLLFGLGIGLIASALMVSYRDIKYVLPVAVQMLMFACPVMYTTAAAPEKWRWFFNINPLTPLIEGFRYSLLPNAAAPNWNLAGISAGATVLIFVLGLFSFKRMERRFADVI